jgi:hydrogenase maturation protein HypF
MSERLRAIVRGAVQGVGFRPFVYRLATELRLTGWVLNSRQGVFIEVDGPRPDLETFRERLDRDRPPRAVIQSLETSWLDSAGFTRFEIRESADTGAVSALVMPDIAVCRDCRSEVEDPSNRRFRYPFTNCTNCGPRFSIIESLPYDRPNTSMRQFEMCPACRNEYGDPLDQRFHAQPNACPVCGPQLALWSHEGKVLASGDDAMRMAGEAVRDGRILAVKGLGGFHLVVDARLDDAVRRLRHRKHREEKPFAVMCGSLTDVERHAVVSRDEARLLTSPEAPIVLLSRRPDGQPEIVAAVAPGNPNLGILLPYTPLHLLLVGEVCGPIVATSGNLSDEPICTDEYDALERLSGIADLFLVHDRPIVRHVDDSIVRVLAGRELVLRRARGYAPLPIPLRRPAPPLLAVGAHLKNAVALTAGPNVFVSQHIGDLESRESSNAFFQVIDNLERLYETTPDVVIADLHPDYLATRYAASLGPEVRLVQHHYAHVAACMAENDLDGPVLGVAWDGTGYGVDGTVWGGEFLAVDAQSFVRAACLRPFRLPGGDRAAREPRRSALGVLHAVFGDEVARMDGSTTRAFTTAERTLLIETLRRCVNAPVTTSAGRLFDAVASIVDCRQRASFEGQAALDLESAITTGIEDAYPFSIGDPPLDFPGSWQAPRLVIDWAPAIRAIVDQLAAETPAGVVAARFHNTLVEMIVTTAAIVGNERVVLTGGCFQNRYLTERAISRLSQAGFRPYWHQRVPPNDGGIAVGQIAAYLRSSAVSPDILGRGHHEVELLATR